MNNDKLIALQSIDHVRRLLNRAEKVIKGGKDKFTTLELTDIANILGLESYELKELFNLSDKEINVIEQFLD